MTDAQGNASGKESFNILSLDGGGIRGAFTAAFLAELEARIGRPLAGHFDLIAGTSTGAIVAAGLAFGVSAADILRFYREHGPAIFARRRPKELKWYQRMLVRVGTGFAKKHFGFDLDADSFLQSKYESGPLRAALASVFGDRLLEDAPVRLVIPSVNLTLGRTKVFKTPHLENLILDRERRVVDILLATTAAPTYFPHATVGDGNYVDGGLWANNPSMVAVTEALKITACRRPGVDPDFNLETVAMLSIGTGMATQFFEPPVDGAGLGWWLPNLFDVSSNAQSRGVDFQMQYVLGGRYRRIDFVLPDASWKLDSIAYLDRMIHQGQEAAVARIGEIKELFLGKAAPRYTPFPNIRPPATAQNGQPVAVHGDAG
jgi:predicted acylesterase/phospholipase RssA